jgi:Fe-Mn family superoxide dismutase
MLNRENRGVVVMAFTLPELPYPYDALEPHIDARTMEIHHTKHHQAYVSNLNKALETHSAFQAKTIDEIVKNLDAIPEAVRTAVRNNGGGHWNHTLFWHVMSKKGGGEPKGTLGDAIKKTFGSFDAFKEEFGKAAIGRFGSGWAWLGFDENGKLHVESTPNQDTPVSRGHVPILGLDVWEHAYYLKYQNRRPDYVSAWWSVVNWEEVQRRYEEATR